MAEYLIQDTTLADIADAVRAKTGKTDAILVSDMATEIANISVGVELNFEVVGGTTEPINPINNTVWVNTDVEITDWIFSYSEPENPIEGMVWISVGNSSVINFNALKIGGIQVCPVGFTQYINGTWINKDSAIYQNGNWMSLELYLYNMGNPHDDITGGFKSDKNIVNATEQTVASSTMEYSDGLMVFTAEYTGGSNAALCYCGTVNKIDLSNIREVYFVIDHATDAQIGAYVTIVDDYSKLSYNGDGAIAQTEIPPSTTRQRASVDVSSLTGEYYVCVRAVVGGLTNTCTIKTSKIGMVLL